MMTLNSAQLYVMLNQYGRHLERSMANIMHVFNNTNEYDVHASHCKDFFIYSQFTKHVKTTKVKAIKTYSLFEK